MSRLIVNYNPNNALAISVIDVMRKSGAFTFENDKESAIAKKAQKYFSGEEYEEVVSRNFLVNEPAPCLCNSEEGVIQRIQESEESGVASESEVNRLFALWDE